MVVLLLLSLLPGCMGVQTFRLVDAQSGLPLDGVQGERLHGSIQASQVPLVLHNVLDPVESQNSDAAGRVAFQASGTKFMFNPTAKNQMSAYGEAYVTAGWSGVKICYPTEHREISVKPVAGVVEVPLRNRRPVAHAQPAEYLAPANREKDAAAAK
jgi:hypothetical protein